MRRSVVDQYFVSSFFLILLGAVFMGIAALTDRRDLTTAAVILSATVLFLTGVLLFTFSKRESLDERFVSVLPVQEMINLCRVAADLGIAGSAVLLPKERTGHQGVMQLMPVSVYTGGDLSGDSFVSGSGGSGLLVPPAGITLQEVLIRYHQVTIVEDRQGLATLIQEVGVQVLEVADAVSVVWSEDGVGITMDGYRLIDGCRRVAKESPACCRMNPCPVCSLFVSFIVEGLNQPVQMDRCMAEVKRDTVQISMSILP